MKRLKVLMIGPDRNAKGGVATVINQYFSNGLDEAVDLYFLKTASEGTKCNKLFVFLKAICKFICIAKKYDVVHIHMASRGSYQRKRLFVFWAKKVFNKKVIIHLHGAEFKEFYHNESDIKKKKDIRNTFYYADAIIALSEQWKEILLDIIKETRIEVIPNAVGVANKTHNYSNQNVLFMGRVGERKGIYDVISIWPQMVKKYPNANLYVAGDGDIENCRLYCRKLNVENSIKVLGWVDEKKREELLDNSSIFVLPSYNEGLPMAMLEAMSRGLAVVVSRVGGIPDVVRQDKNGLLIDAGNQNMIEDALSRLCEDEVFKKDIGKNARKTIEQEYSIEIHIKKVLSLYSDLGCLP